MKNSKQVEVKKGKAYKMFMYGAYVAARRKSKGWWVFKNFELFCKYSLIAFSNEK